jgi:hypothetical protein
MLWRVQVFELNLDVVHHVVAIRITFFDKIYNLVKYQMKNVFPILGVLDIKHVHK